MSCSLLSLRERETRTGSRRESVAMPPAQTPEPAQLAQSQAQKCCCACPCEKKSAALFVDEDFPARWHVLNNATFATAWLRPHEIRKEPRLFVDEVSRFHVNQGNLGDCWFMAGCAAVAERPDLLKKIVPEGQVLYGPGYDGSVTFRLWHQGEWQEVRIDDRIPVDAEGVPVYARCKHKDEFWLPLLEKAFAKFHKHFGEIEGGWPSEGLLNLTGYSTLQMKLEEWNVWNMNNCFETLKKAFEVEALILCHATKATPGIPGCHAYTVTKIFHRSSEKEGEEEMQLVRVRNPWGNVCKWSGGAWKDGDERWDKLSSELKEALEYKPEENGEFWMNMNDFTNSFHDVTIASPNPFGTEKMKMITHVTGQWSDDENAGGDHNDIEKFAKNPQFLLVALGAQEPDADGDCDEPINFMEGMDAIVELQRGHCRKKHKHSPNIAFYVFETTTERRLTAEQMLQLTYVTGATDFHYEAAVSCAVHLRPGRRYVVVPATNHPGQQGDFVLRVFSRQVRVSLAELPAEPTKPEVPAAPATD